MAYHFTINFSGNAPVHLTAETAEESERMQAALAALKANYVIRAEGWIGGSFQMTAEDRKLLDRLVPGLCSKITSDAPQERAA
jgi:hypothetical protein